MLRYILSRLLTFLPTFFGVTLISFGFIRVLPGDPVGLAAGPNATPAEIEAERLRYRNLP